MNFENLLKIFFRFIRILYIIFQKHSLCIYIPKAKSQTTGTIYWINVPSIHVQIKAPGPNIEHGYGPLGLYPNWISYSTNKADFILVR